MIKIYTDGACSGNPGPGGWGFVIIDGENTKSFSGGEDATCLLYTSDAADE